MGSGGSRTLLLPSKLVGGKTWGQSHGSDPDFPSEFEFCNKVNVASLDATTTNYKAVWVLYGQASRSISTS
jgi:hypothetical protein